MQTAKEIFRLFRDRVNALPKEFYAAVKKPLRELLDIAQEVVAYGDRSYRRVEEEPGAGDALENRICLMAKRPSGYCDVSGRQNRQSERDRGKN